MGRLSVGLVVVWLGLISSAAMAAEFKITVVAGPDSPVAGRLLLFAKAAKPGESAPEAVDTDEFSDKDVFVASREIANVKPGQTLVLDGRDSAWPASLDQLPAGTYWVQAVLDGDHSYAYSGRSEDDAVSSVVKVTLPVDETAQILALKAPLPALPYWIFPGGHVIYSPADKPEIDARIKPIDFTSRKLSAFWGRDISMKGLVVTPRGMSRARPGIRSSIIQQGLRRACALWRIRPSP